MIWLILALAALAGALGVLLVVSLIVFNALIMARARTWSMLWTCVGIGAALAVAVAALVALVNA